MPKRRLVRVRLREQVLSRGGHVVDRKAGIIKNVKVLGLDSVNGRRYLPEAVRKAMPLYQNCPVNVDHPAKKDGPYASRSSYDRFGKLINVRFVEGDGLYADLAYLKTHPLARRIEEAAQRMDDLFGLSHNAQGDGETKDGVFVVASIEEVRSVDIVADPATTKGLFESRSRAGRAVKSPRAAAPLMPRIPTRPGAQLAWLRS